LQHAREKDRPNQEPLRALGIIEFIDDLEDLYLAQKRSASLERGKTKTIPPDKLERALDLAD
jgi:predicted DNA-binding protein